MLLAFSAFQQASAQPAPPKVWDYRYGGTGGDDMNCAVQTADGGYLLGGESQSYIGGDKSQNPVGWYDYWIVKLNENGGKEWDATYGGPYFDYLLGLQQTTDGGYILAGYSLSGAGGDKTQASFGDEDYWIVKIDASGVKQWDASFGGDSTDVLRSVSQTSDGGYVLCGFSDSGISGNKTAASKGGRDYWVVKTDENGNMVWDKSYGGSDFDQGNYISQTLDGGLILGGFSASPVSGDKSQPNQGTPWTYDYWILKTDAAGVKEWDARFGGTDYDYLYSLTETADSGYALGGYSTSGVGGDKTEPKWGNEDYWLVRVDKNGTKLWDKRYGGADNDYAVDVRQSYDGGFLLGGYSDSDISGDKTQDNWGVLFTYDYWVVKTDASGVKQWDTRYGGTDWEQLTVAFPTADAGYFFAGFSNSPVSGDKTQPSQGYDDYWVVKLACDSSKIYYADNDHDNYGDPGFPVFGCSKPKGYVEDSTDCDDTNINVNPGAVEIAGNGIDDDCDGDVDEIATGIAGNISLNNRMLIYPNPATEKFTVAFSSTKINGDEAIIEIENSYGIMLLRKPVTFINGGLTFEMNVDQSWTAGIYFVRIISGEEIISTKISIVK